MKRDTAKDMQRSHGSASLIERAAERLARSRVEDDEADEPQTATAGDARPSAGGTSRSTGRSLHIDLERLQDMGYLTPSGMRSRLAEEVRLIKRSVVQNLLDDNLERANLIMVTSAFPGEGKSFTTLNLAMSLACEMDFRVLLVDADFERPVVFKRLGLQTSSGLMDVLTDTTRSLADVIWRTNIERLSLIGPGRSDDLSPEWLGSQRMNQLTRELAERYPDRIILFDTPPLLSSSEPAVMAEHMGQVLFVVEANGTTREMIGQAVERLPQTCAVGMVLNKGREMHGSYMYPYYGYRTDSDRAEGD